MGKPLVGQIDLKVIYFDCCSANISWNRPNVSHDYHIYYRMKTAPGKEWLVMDASHTQERLEALRPWANYTVSVRLCIRDDTEEYCGPWDSVRFQTRPAAPGQPRNVNVTKSTDHYQVSWTAPSDANGPLSGYEITWYSPPDADVPSGKLYAENVLRPRVDLRAPKEGARCLVRLVAFNDYQGERLMGAPVTVTLLA